MDKYNVYVGMDAHARSVTAQALITETGETKKKRFGADYTAAEIASWAKSLGDRIYCAYESGCTGVWLARELRELGISCDIIAISTLARSTKDIQEKCDKLDAKAILREISNPMPRHSCIYIPTQAEEGLRDISRIYTRAKDDAKRTKQELRSFLLRHGYVWNNKTKTGRLQKPTGRAYNAWLSQISFECEDVQYCFCTLVRKMREAQEELALMKKKMGELAKRKDNAPYVEALSCIKGIDTLNAMIVKAEFCNFERFTSGRKVSSWLGCVPKNNSSGSKEAHGSITKAGNKYLRRTLVEGVCSISTWNTAQKRPLKKTSDTWIALIAKDANTRLSEKYRRLVRAGKNTNKAKVAVVNELVRWCWAIGREVQRRSLVCAG